MSSTTRRRPTETDGGNGDKGNAHGDHPKRGVAGTIQRTHTTAPEGASVDLIQRVALTAHNEGVDPAEVWQRESIQNHTLAEFSGGDSR